MVPACTIAVQFMIPHTINHRWRIFFFDSDEIDYIDESLLSWTSAKSSDDVRGTCRGYGRYLNIAPDRIFRNKFMVEANKAA